MINAGFTYSQIPEESDIVAINTCGFIKDAKEESIDYILDIIKLKKSGKIEKVIVMGCLSERYSEELKNEFPEVDYIFGVESQQQIIKELSKQQNVLINLENGRNLITPDHYAYLKIAEGCSNTCSFCSIPLIRGIQRSRTIDSIIRESKYLYKRGVKELILIAQDLTRYGTDLYGKRRLTDLLNKILALELFPRVRLMYSNPDFWDPGLLELFEKYPALCPYLDIPIQHASNKILKLMGRAKKQGEIRHILNSIRKRVPHIGLRTSVMVGFPSENDDDFRQLLDFIEEMRFERLGVFCYSEEEGTKAAKLSDDISEEEKERRKEIVMEIQYDISTEFAESKIGEKPKVIIDSKNESGYIGRTVWDAPEVDCSVIIPGERKLDLGEIYNVRIEKAAEFDLIGKIEN